MKFLLDENFPKSAVLLLDARGHHVLDVRGSQYEGAEDSEVFEWAQQERAIFLTTDRDFFHTIPHLYGDHYGVLVIALRQPNRSKILKRLEWFLDSFQAVDVANRVFQLRDKTYLVLPPGNKE
jgi:predicted nuclease of predicted toxin-antitoxin system